MKRLKIAHFPQDPCYCAVASCAVVGNYFDSSITYEYTKDIADKEVSKKIGEEGLESGDMCILLNKLGINKITMISSDTDIFDYTWENYGKRKLAKTLEDAFKHKLDKTEREKLQNIHKWYVSKNSTNIIKIDHNFRKHICKHLNRRKPVIVSLSWTVLMRYCKEGEKGLDPINGNSELHAVVLNGYDDKGVWIVDSHRDYYKYKRKRYRKGYYKISWDTLLTCMGTEGDILLPEEYIGY